MFASDTLVGLFLSPLELKRHLVHSFLDRVVIFLNLMNFGSGASIKIHSLHFALIFCGSFPSVCKTTLLVVRALGVLYFFEFWGH